MVEYLKRITEMKNPKAPETPKPGTRFLLSIETDAAGLDAKGVVERFQKFFDFYHPAYHVKVREVSTVSVCADLVLSEGVLAPGDFIPAGPPESIFD